MRTVQTDAWIDATRAQIREVFGIAKEALQKYTGTVLPRASMELREAERRCLEFASLLNSRPEFAAGELSVLTQGYANDMREAERTLRSYGTPFPQHTLSSSAEKQEYYLGQHFVQCARVVEDILGWFNHPGRVEIPDAKVDALIERIRDDAPKTESLPLEAIMGLMDAEQIQIIAIRDNPKLGVDEKMRAIYAIDNRALGWDSNRWGEMLGCTANNIRMQEWWRVDRKRLAQDG